MSAIDIAEKQLLEAILSADEVSDDEIRRLALRVVTGGKTHAELRASLAERVDVRVPIDIAPLLVTSERLSADVKSHGDILAARVAANRAIMQGVAMAVLGGLAAASGGGAGAILPAIKPALAELLKLIGVGGADSGTTA